MFALRRLDDRQRKIKSFPASKTRWGLFAFSLATFLTATTAPILFASQIADRRELVTQNANVRVHNSKELQQAVQAAQAGTTILLEPGTYRGGLTFNRLHGTSDHPIVIMGVDPDNLPIIHGGNSCLHLREPAHLELRNLVLTGAWANGLNIDDGGTFNTPAHHVLLAGLHIHKNGSNGNHDGIKFSGVDDFRIENCTIERWGKKGSGIDMVGCHRGVVENCTFHDGDSSFANAVQMKGGSSEITVNRCRFDDAGGRAINIGGSTGLPYFRPKPQGFEAKNITVSDCTFIGSMAPIAFVGVDGPKVHHNTFYRPTRWVIRILQENQGSDFTPCRKGIFSNNIIAFQTDELASTINIGSGTDPKSFKFSKNFWYCLNRPGTTRPAVQLPAGETESIYGHDPKFSDSKKGDFRLAPGSPARDFGPRAIPKENAPVDAGN